MTRSPKRSSRTSNRKKRLVRASAKRKSIRRSAIIRRNKRVFRSAEEGDSDFYIRFLAEDMKSGYFNVKKNDVSLYVMEQFKKIWKKSNKPEDIKVETESSAFFQNCTQGREIVNALQNTFTECTVTERVKDVGNSTYTMQYFKSPTTDYFLIHEWIDFIYDSFMNDGTGFFKLTEFDRTGGTQRYATIIPEENFPLKATDIFTQAFKFQRRLNGIPVMTLRNGKKLYDTDIFELLHIPTRIYGIIEHATFIVDEEVSVVIENAQDTIKKDDVLSYKKHLETQLELKKDEPLYKICNGVIQKIRTDQEKMQRVRVKREAKETYKALLDDVLPDVLREVAEEAQQARDAEETVGKVIKQALKDAEIEQAVQAIMETLLQEEAKFIACFQENIDEFTCPITRVPYDDPVVASDGFTYERNVIERYIQDQKEPKSPITGEQLNSTVYPNLKLKILMQHFPSAKKS